MFPTCIACERETGIKNRKKIPGAEPGVFLPVQRHRGSRDAHETDTRTSQTGIAWTERFDRRGRV